MIDEEKAVSRRVSTRFTRTGALIEDTYNAFRSWDVNKTINENADYIFKTNLVGAKSERQLERIKITLTSRFGAGPSIAPLVTLAKARCPIEKWKCCLQWHIAQVDELYFQFVTEWLYNEFERGAYILHAPDLLPYIESKMLFKIAKGKGISDYAKIRLARDLFRLATQFGQLKGGNEKQFNPHRLPDDVFLYVLHALRDQSQSTRKIIESQDWKLYLMSSSDVEKNLLDLHQYKKLHYDAAGSVYNLDLPCKTLIEYSEKMANNG